MQVIYLLTTDRYNSELLLNNSRTRVDLFRFLHTRNDEEAVVSFRFFQLSTIALKKSRRMFDCYASVYIYFLWLQRAKTTLHHLTSKRHGRWEGWRHKTAPNSLTHFRPVNCCRIEHEFLPLSIYWCRRGVLEYIITFQWSSYATVWNSH